MNDTRSTVRAIGLTEYGGPDVLREVQVTREPLGPGDVRIRVTAAAVNPTDTFLRAGSRATSDRPVTADVPGMDVAGDVAEAGPDVRTVAPGDRVIALVLPAGEHGAYRSEIVVPAECVVKTPAGATDEAASTLPLNGLTARLALLNLGLAEGDVLAVTGAAGALGGVLVQLAHAEGLIVIADASESDRDLVRGMGADHVVPRGADFARHVRTLHPAGVDGLADAAAQGAEVMDAVRDGGSAISFRGYTGDGTDRIRVVAVSVREVARRHDLLEQLRDQAERGVITLRVAEVLPASRAPEAHRRLADGGVRGRFVLDFSH